MKEQLLIIDDVEIIRANIRALFEDYYEIYEASNGQEGLSIIRENTIDVVLLDLMMPVMSGLDFLKILKDNKKYCEIPVVVVTESDATSDQLDAFELGANDYVVKPFIPQIVLHRVNNASLSYKRLKKILDEKKSLIKRAELDQLTGIYNKITAEHLMRHILTSFPFQNHALFILDIDDFKSVNDIEGHLKGDHTLKIVADLFSSHFREDDIVGRFGGDEFIVLMKNIPSRDIAISKAEDVIRLLAYKPNLTIPANITTSIGVAFSDGKKCELFELFKKADIALYKAKDAGKGRFCIYEESDQDFCRTNDDELEKDLKRTVDEIHRTLY